jgi:hypothetical protein
MVGNPRRFLTQQRVVHLGPSVGGEQHGYGSNFQERLHAVQYTPTCQNL